MNCEFRATVNLNAQQALQALGRGDQESWRNFSCIVAGLRQAALALDLLPEYQYTRSVSQYMERAWSRSYAARFRGVA